jgi:hypothetical protein
MKSTLVERQIVGSSPGQVKPNTKKLIFDASPLSKQYKDKEQRLIGSGSG